MIKTAIQAIDNYFFIKTGEGTVSDRIWFFGGHAFFIGITLFTIL